MRVVLLKKIANLGQTGEIKEVADGYARNFLLPQGLVKVATEAVIKQLELKKQKQQKKSVNKAKQYKELAKKINNLKIIMQAKADDKKTLFAAVKEADIAQELKNRNYDIPVQFIKLDQPIKQLGYYDIQIRFDDELTSKIGLTIKREDS
ncbi:MAG: 50S ribosomal protein L9 [Candidatus Buchananbacteria bacterium]|nr:50S ribosomal protein L9 [Candidatus Buchananbacteria bacterium]